LHRGQSKSKGGRWRKEFNRALKGTMSQAIFHKKSFSLSLSFNFHKSFKEFKAKGEIAASVLGLLIRLKADLEENKSFGEGVQMKEGEEGGLS
jgi:hypothetical protein